MRPVVLAGAVLVACGGGGATVPDAAPGTWWQPAPGTSWQWQLSGTVDTSVDASMYDIDLFDNAQAVIDTLHGAGRRVVCYVDAGSWEPNRPDAAQFPSDVLGKALVGWPDERWLDVRDPRVVALIDARLDVAAQKHCDGVEPDNVDGYANDTGFPLTADDQLAFDRHLASAAHARGLSVGLKNDLDQIGALVADVDWALDEQCHQYSECDLLAPFIAAGKPVFNTEYGDASLATTVCPDANGRNFDALIKMLDLGAWRVACR